MNLYEILGVKEDASPEEIKRAYRGATLKWHPDKAYLLSDEEKNQNSLEKIKAINNAYEILYDPDKRSQYDISLASASAANTSTSSANTSTNTSPDSDKTFFFTQLDNLLTDLATGFRTENIGSNSFKKAQSDFAFVKAAYEKLSPQLTDNDRNKITELIQQRFTLGVRDMPENEREHIAEMGAKAFLSLLNGEQALSNASLAKASIKILSKSTPRDRLVDILKSYAEIQASNDNDEKNLLLHQLMIHLANNHKESDLLEKTVNSIMVKAKKSEKTAFINNIQTDLAAYKASIGINPPAASAAATSANENQRSNREDPYKKRAQKYGTNAMRNPSTSKGTGYSSEALRPNKSSNEDVKKEKTNIFRRMFK